ncbi:hypothetical protein QUB80_26000 [Chlorogloeopsis sp. ULAP01]|uniref:hypothetical protein n=1 Tax=Chlorogloeopsis sp. ULAP01 TaxID=3056483 RepID=UPI0025AB41B8|nr:hypothetical protein [Chlorogloeopsis sp. ULAP01]MDM9384133.1 hypothetical protein [Chlorogloeopsis sp. ULAP01]
MRVPRVVDAQRAASRRVAPGVTWRRVKRVVATGVTWRRVKRVECDCRAGLEDKSSVLAVHIINETRPY